MNTPLHVLIIEDRADDVELLVSELRRAGFVPAWQVVNNPAEYLFALAEQPQVIIAGCSPSGITALGALDMLHEQGYDIPVIVVSEAVNEGFGIECLRRGAADYLCEDRLARLGPAIERALQQRRLVADRRRAERIARLHERRFRAAFDHAPVGMALTTAHGYVIDVNHALSKLTGFSVEEIREGGLSELVVAQDRPLIEIPDADRPIAAGNGLDGSLGGRPSRHEIRLLRAVGEPILVRYSAALVDDALESGGSGVGWHVIHQFVAAHEAPPAALRPAANLPAVRAPELV